MPKLSYYPGPGNMPEQSQLERAENKCAVLPNEDDTTPNAMRQT
jgi:hypothetical protein